MHEQVVEVLRAELTRVSYERNQAEQENEMLRGLLREWLDRGAHDKFYTVNLVQRVREALGEKP